MIPLKLFLKSGASPYPDVPKAKDAEAPYADMKESQVIDDSTYACVKYTGNPASVRILNTKEHPEREHDTIYSTMKEELYNSGRK